jgi:serine/threonine-protein kinase RsbW
MSGQHPLGDGDMRIVTLRLESRLDHVELVARAVRALCSTAGLPGRECAQVELAVGEALNNVIRHAYHGEAGHPIEVTFAQERAQFTIEVADEGEPMPPGRPVAFDFDPSDIAHLPEGGMGIFLIHSVMDRVEYRRLGDRNALTMSHRLAA